MNSEQLKYENRSSLSQNLVQSRFGFNSASLRVLLHVFVRTILESMRVPVVYECVCTGYKWSVVSTEYHLLYQ